MTTFLTIITIFVGFIIGFILAVFLFVLYIEKCIKTSILDYGHFKFKLYRIL